MFAVMAPTGHVLARLHHFSVGTQGIGVLPGQDTPVFLEFGLSSHPSLPARVCGQEAAGVCTG